MLKPLFFPYWKTFKNLPCLLRSCRHMSTYLDIVRRVSTHILSRSFSLIISLILSLIISLILLFYHFSITFMQALGWTLLCKCWGVYFYANAGRDMLCEHKTYVLWTNNTFSCIQRIYVLYTQRIWFVYKAYMFCMQKSYFLHTKKKCFVSREYMFCKKIGSSLALGIVYVLCPQNICFLKTNRLLAGWRSESYMCCVHRIYVF